MDTRTGANRIAASGVQSQRAATGRPSRPSALGRPSYPPGVPSLRLAALVVATACAIVGLPAIASAAVLRPLVTGVTDPETFSSANAAVAFRRVRASGATTAVLTLDWSAVAPSGASPPAGFDASDPGDARYHWAAIDRQVSLAVRTKLDPIIDIVDAPRWAQPRTAKAPYQPDPAAFGDFAHAAALRYSGGYAMLPRVRYWEAWNEPNLTTFLLPQFLDGRPFSPGWYRTMVNAFAAGVHSAARGNVVIAGATAPFADRGVDEVADWGPLTFMRDLLCLSASLQPTCSDKITFDVWSTHPYTSGGPKHHAFRRDDVSLGDLPKMRRILLAAQRAHHIRLTRSGLGFWVTEFSWDSSPPDPQAVPIMTLQQWIPRALYVMWLNGITHVTWFTIHDDPMSSSTLQSGLYFNGGSFARDKAKPFLANFRFPVVVVIQAGGAHVWGRTPAGLPAGVAIQTTSTSGWRTVGSATTDKYGIFQTRVQGALGTYVRAVIPASGDASGRFRVKPIADHFYNPFGTTPPLEPQG